MADVIHLSRAIRVRSRIASSAGDKAAAYRLARQADAFEPRPSSERATAIETVERIGAAWPYEPWQQDGGAA